MRSLLSWLDPRLKAGPGTGRWVIVDVETGGLDPHRDALLAIGALGVTDLAVDLADAFEVVLRQDTPSARGNIEIHGIAGCEQEGGEEPRAALTAFLDFIGDDPLVAFHAPFDAAALRRAVRQHLGRGLDSRWLDLANLAPIVWPGRAGDGLDAWLEAFRIPMARRHRAIVDCLGTAQLFVAATAQAPRLGVRTTGRILAACARPALAPLRDV